MFTLASLITSFLFYLAIPFSQAIAISNSQCRSLPEQTSTQHRRRSLPRRLETLLSHTSNLNLTQSSFSTNLKDTLPDDKDKETISWSKNWAGAVHTGAGYRTVKGTIILPEIHASPPSSNDSDINNSKDGSFGMLYAVSAWMGIDGERACPGVILQAGVDLLVRGEGGREYWAWYEWYPQYARYLLTFPLSSGDPLSITVTATSLTSAHIIFHNLRTHRSQTINLSDQSPPLCGFHAEWIVEDFWDSDGVPPVDFGRLVFEKVGFETDGGVKGGVEGTRMEGIRESMDKPVVVQCVRLGVEGMECDFLGGRG